MSESARKHATRILAETEEKSVWIVSLHLPPVSVELEASDEESARRAALQLSVEQYAKAMAQRLSLGRRPALGDIIGSAEKMRPDDPRRRRQVAGLEEE